MFVFGCVVFCCVCVSVLLVLRLCCCLVGFCMFEFLWVCCVLCSVFSLFFVSVVWLCCLFFYVAFCVGDVFFLSVFFFMMLCVCLVLKVRFCKFKLF